MYSKIKVYGNCDLDYVWVKKKELSTVEKNELANNGIYNIPRTEDTIMLVNFDGTISDNTLGINQNAHQYLVQRKEINSSKIEDVALTPWNKIKDWSCKSNKTYEYFITPLYVNNSGQEVFGERVTTNIVSTAWAGVSIIDLIPTSSKGYYKTDTSNIWVFGLNLEDIMFTSNNDITFTNTYGRFPKEHRGKINYLTASIKCLLGNVFSCKYDGDDIVKIEAFREFCNNGNLKLFKDPKGNVIPCSIRSNTDTSDFSTVNKQTMISFDIVQLASNENISVFSEVI